MRQPTPIMFLSEAWKPVVGSGGLYEVSSFGQVKRVGRKRGAVVGRILCQGDDRDGYPSVELRDRFGCRHSMQRVHKLVTAAFIGKRPSALVTNHKDGNKRNNHVGNLEYVTPLQNSLHQNAHRLRAYGERNAMTTLRASEIITVRALVAGGMMQKDVAKMFRMSPSGLNGIVQRKTWRHL